MTAERIDICICTFRRESLRQTLRSVAEQRLPADITLKVIVADNDHSDDRRAAIVSDGAALGLDLLYVHAPSRNISVARNACLDAATARLIAFIDDDEEAAPNWIAALLDQSAAADIVFGVSQARYPDPQTPGWIQEGDFHSNRVSGNDAPWNGYTANVLINRVFAADHALRFARELGQIGGEDTVFFYHAHARGARFAYAPLAIVYEDTPPNRATMAWLMKRRFRSGQVHYMLLKLQNVGLARVLVSSLAKAAYCIVGAALNLAYPTRRANFVLRGSLHVGVAASALGMSPYIEYSDQNVTGA